MTAKENMIHTLEKIGLYQFHKTQKGIFESEINAYGAGFSLLETEINRLLEDLFLETASPEILGEKEKLFRYLPSLGTVSDRRKMLLARYGDIGENAAVSRFQNLLTAVGIDGTLQENREEGKLTVTVHRFIGVTKEEAIKELEELLPAHLEIEVLEEKF